MFNRKESNSPTDRFHDEELECESESADAVFLDARATVIDPLEDLQRGAHGFQCRTCGRRWATDPAW